MTEPPHRRGQDHDGLLPNPLDPFGVFPRDGEAPFDWAADHDGLLHRPAITPALTAEEWASGVVTRDQPYDIAVVVQRTYGEPPGVLIAQGHEAATVVGTALPPLMALANDALHDGDPLKFTSRDVRRLLDEAEDLRASSDSEIDHEVADWLASLAFRIRALLPA